ncbi:hypothetical protein K2P97_02340 [bacterium]|nr:hypothetical protein [bacterium]
MIGKSNWGGPLKQYLLSPVCLKCSSFFCNDSLFCSGCYKKEIKFKLVHTDNISHVQNHHYLFEWRKSENNILSQLVYRLKSDNSVRAWYFYADLMFKKLNAETDFKNFEAIVPVPGSNKNSVHSYIFAQALSQISSIPVLDILQKDTGSKQQKRLNAIERKLNNPFSLKQTQLEEFTNCLLVDDILTTGTSFQQSNGLLIAPENNTVASLFYRPK